MLLAAVFLGLLIATTSAQKKPKSPKPDCSSQPHKGKSCGKNKPALRYYYDEKIGECLPFYYGGCGGNRNNFQTPSACGKSCNKAKPDRCEGGVRPTGRCKKTGDCPKGSVCKMGTSGLGVCCRSKTEEEFKKDRNPECGKGKVLIRTYTQKGWKPLLGRKCAQNFCPKFSKCVQGRHLAHCCGPKEKFRRDRA